LDISINITPEQTEYLRIAAESLKKAIKQIWEHIKEIFKWFVQLIKKSKVPGYIRLMKKDELAYYESIADGKSNNWRRLHGLLTVRTKKGRYKWTTLR
jgi:hypothetical protein